MNGQQALPGDEQRAVTAMVACGREYRAVRAAQKAGTPKLCLWHARNLVQQAARLVDALDDLIGVPLEDRVIPGSER